ncbi:DNA cytosine methyltransferase [Vreelandella sedimenti]|uniref:DNA cytosine methyltransferase n=1 Tax=Vreelandella sedimenti TaxID=2729618 RepID=UPI00257F4DE6|nr:DNA (cytosine-5-)-methyltransferase [Halomonas sp. UBA3173]|tara:strand:+ start:24720 stop:25817 length:1098 start_codon:yes stop_codon:yes gene_type:complete
MKAISLFTGAGGMDVGFQNAGFDVVWANDFDKDACGTYRLNYGDHIRHGSIDDLMPELKELGQTGGISCLFGGPPCQGFSVAGKMDAQDPRSKLVWSYMQAVSLVRPAAFVMENVKSLATLDKFRAIREGFIKEAIKLGYNVDLMVLNSKEFGIPQGRERMFLVGFRDRPNHFRDLIDSQRCSPPRLRDVLLDVGKIGSPQNNRICKAKITAAAKPILRRSPYAGMLFNGQGRPLNLEGHASTLPASMGGNRTPIIDDEALYGNQTPWIEEYHAHLMSGGEPIDWKSVPGRLRRMSVDEAIAIQTFPRDYKFAGSQSSVFKQIGNAVPCMLAESVARVVFELLSESPSAVKKRCKISKELQLELT